MASPAHRLQAVATEIHLRPDAGEALARWQAAMAAQPDLVRSHLPAQGGRHESWFRLLRDSGGADRLLQVRIGPAVAFTSAPGQASPIEAAHEAFRHEAWQASAPAGLVGLARGVETAPLRAVQLRLVCVSSEDAPYLEEALAAACARPAPEGLLEAVFHLPLAGGAMFALCIRAPTPARLMLRQRVRDTLLWACGVVVMADQLGELLLDVPVG